MKTAELCIIYTTIGSVEEGRAIARKLVEQQRIVCAHIFPAGHSVYPWEGKVVEENEIVMFLKTKEVLKSEAMSQLESLHPYECPCILSFDITEVNAPYFDWVSNNLGA